MNVQQRLAELELAVLRVLEAPNEILPEEMHDNREGCRTLDRLVAVCDERDGITEHQRRKLAKARNIERLAAQVSGRDIDKPLDYSQNETDDIMQHRAEMALVGGMVSGGLIDADDLEVE